VTTEIIPTATKNLMHYETTSNKDKIKKSHTVVQFNKHINDRITHPRPTSSTSTLLKYTVSTEAMPKFKSIKNIITLHKHFNHTA